MGAEEEALSDKWAAAAVAASTDMLVAVAEEEALPEADNPDNREAAMASKAVVEADRAGACPEGHAIYNNRNPIPTTNRRRLESKPTGSICSSTVLRPLSAASA